MLPATLDRKDLDRVFSQPLPSYFVKEEVDRILSANAHDPRVYLLVNVLWKTGARVSEVLSLKKTDLDPYSKTLRVETLKRGVKLDHKDGVGRKKKPEKTSRTAERLLVVPDDLVAGLSAWILSGNVLSDGRIWKFTRWTAGRIVKEACARAGFADSRGHPHTFRHSYAVHLLRNGVPVTVLKDLLGHSNIANTLVYLRITQPDIRVIINQVQW